MRTPWISDNDRAGVQAVFMVCLINLISFFAGIVTAALLLDALRPR